MATNNSIWQTLDRLQSVVLLQAQREKALADGRVSLQDLEQVQHELLSANDIIEAKERTIAALQVW